MSQMKYSLAIAAVSATLLSASALAQTVPPPAVSVTGEATVSVAPDQAQIDGGVTSDARTAREASEANNAAMNKVMQALKGAGIEERDTQTSRLSLQPQYAPNRTGTSPITGYRASNRVTIRLRDVDKGRQRDRRAGGRRRERYRRHQLHGLASRPSTWTRPARRRSRMPAARRRFTPRPPASTLGEPLSISEEGAPAPLFRGKMAAPMAAGAPVAQGEETLSVTVNVSWAIKAKAQ